MIAWTAVLCADGEPVTGEVPCTEWIAAELLAFVVAGWVGGPVSVGQAVFASRERETDAQASLFDEVAV